MARCSLIWPDGGAGELSAGGWRSAREDHRLEIQFDDWDTEYACALEIHRGRFHCSIPGDRPADVARARRIGVRAQQFIGRRSWIRRLSIEATLSLKRCGPCRARLGDCDTTG